MPGATVPRSLLLPPQDGWLAAEGWDAVRQLDGACDALNAWQPAQLVLGLPQEGDDFLATTPRSR